MKVQKGTIWALFNQAVFMQIVADSIGLNGVRDKNSMSEAIV